MSSFGKFPTPKAKSRSGPRSPEEAMSYRSKPVTQESPESCVEKMAEIEALFTAFSSKYDLESLRAITWFKSEEERRASPRAEALVDIGPIIQLIKFLEGQHAVPREACQHFKRRYSVLTNTIIGALQDSPEGVGEIVIHRRVNEDGTIED